MRGGGWNRTLLCFLTLDLVFACADNISSKDNAGGVGNFMIGQVKQSMD
jgi:hypothetical protein